MSTPADAEAEEAREQNLFVNERLTEASGALRRDAARRVLDEYQERQHAIIIEEVKEQRTKRTGWYDMLNGLYYLTIARLVNPRAYRIAQKCLEETHRQAEQDKRIPKE